MPRPRLLALALVAVALTTACGNVFRTAAAVVDDRRVEDDRFRRDLAYFTADPSFQEGVPPEEMEARRENLGRQLLTFLIHQQVVRRYADANGIAITDAQVDERLGLQIEQLGGREQLDRQIEAAGVTLDEVKNLIRAQLVREQVANRVVEAEISDERLQQEYEARQREFTEVRVAHILVPERAQAEDILRQATPQNFSDLAREHSQDQGSAEQGGDLGLRPAGEFVEPFADAALEIPVGEIGGPVQTEFGFHILYVLERNVLTLDEVRDRLMGELGQQVFNEWLLEQIRQADVRVNPRYGTFDERSGQVVERRSTTPEPDVQVTP